MNCLIISSAATVAASAASWGQGIAVWLLDGLNTSLLIYVTRVEMK